MGTTLGETAMKPVVRRVAKTDNTIPKKPVIRTVSSRGDVNLKPNKPVIRKVARRSKLQTDEQRKLRPDESAGDRVQFSEAGQLDGQLDVLEESWEKIDFKLCAVGDAVQCPGSSVMCAGEQCCPPTPGVGNGGSSACPSATSGWNM